MAEVLVSFWSLWIRIPQQWILKNQCNLVSSWSFINVYTESLILLKTLVYILDRSVWRGCSVHPSFCSNKETETWDSVKRTRPCCPVFVKAGPVEMEISNLLFLRHLQTGVVWRPGWIMLLALIWTLPGQVHHRSGVKIQRGDYPLLWPLFLSVHQHPISRHSR